MGASKANSAIVHAGFDAEPRTLKAGIMWRATPNGNRDRGAVGAVSEKWFHGSGLFGGGFENPGELVGARPQERSSRCPADEPEEALSQEPNLSEEIKGALWAPSGGIVCPYELATAAIGNAMDNGAELKTGFRVTGIEKENGNFVVISEAGEKLYARYLG